MREKREERRGKAGQGAWSFAFLPFLFSLVSLL
jgi:hypothetical protein